MSKVLIVVDMLNDFVREGGALFFPDGAAIIPAVKAELEAARERGDKVIFLQDAHKPDDPEFKAFPPHCVEGTEGAAIVDELAPIEGEQVITKQRYSGFYNTGLGNILGQENPDVVRFVGVCTSICVMGTVGDCANRDMKTEVVEKAVADFNPDAHAFALSHMKNIYCADIV
jgi:nicotinamidase/pyrazinamidase